ncbi:hypothetical protein BDZ97DRAFT_1844043 [Flammula alnicola]|nr:hypothetical protein BDZ97DRAFT_1844043 [Flammula alnicola]
MSSTLVECMRRGRRCCDQPPMCCMPIIVRNAVWKLDTYVASLGTLSLRRRKHAPQSWVGVDKERAVISTDAEQIGRRADGEGGAGWVVRQTSSFVINVHSEDAERALMHVWRLSTRGHCRRQGASSFVICVDAERIRGGGDGQVARQRVVATTNEHRAHSSSRRTPTKVGAGGEVVIQVDAGEAGGNVEAASGSSYAERCPALMRLSRREAGSGLDGTRRDGGGVNELVRSSFAMEANTEEVGRGRGES